MVAPASLAGVTKAEPPISIPSPSVAAPTPPAAPPKTRVAQPNPSGMQPKLPGVQLNPPVNPAPDAPAPSTARHGSLIEGTHGEGFIVEVRQAMEEVRNIPPAIIHRASAFKWSARAIASYRVCAVSEVQEDRLRYLYLGEHYREAALAHAAMGEQWEPLYMEVDRVMTEDRYRALEAVRETAPVLPPKPRPKRQAKASKRTPTV